MKDYIVKLDKINLTYNKGKENSFKALYDVNLKVKSGEFLVIFGPSGCGKSSLLNVVAGLERPDNGNITVEGKNVGLLSNKEMVDFHRKKMGMVFQSYNLISTLNVLENVALPQMFINENRKKRNEKALKILDDFGIKDFGKKIPTELSGGQQQRVGIARAIINDPLIILADEPIGNLDTKSANRVMEILGELNKKFKKTVILVSHNPENIIWGNHIIHMKDGKIIKEEFKEIEGAAEKTEIITEAGTKSGFDQLVNRFKGLSTEQISILINPIKAKMISQFLLTPYDEQQIKHIEEIISRKLIDGISYDEMFEFFDKNIEDGGVGLDKRTAKKYFEKIKGFIGVSNKKMKESNVDNQAIIISRYLYEKEKLTIGEKELLKFVKLVRKRLLGEVSYEDLEKELDDKIKLDKRKVRMVMRRMDLIMLISYGLKANNKKDSQQNKDKQNQNSNVGKVETGQPNSVNKKEKEKENLKEDNKSPFL